MKYINEKHSVLDILLTLSLAMLFGLGSTVSLAAKGGGGKPPGGDPPADSECTETFPAFLYWREGDRKSSDQLILSGSQACRQELIAEIPDFRSTYSMYLSQPDASGTVAGVVVWAVDPDNQARYQVIEQKFEVTDQGAFSLSGPPETILDGHDDNAFGTSAEDQVILSQLDLWAPPDQADLYLLTRELVVDIHHETGEIDGEYESSMIYQLSDLAATEITLPASDGCSATSPETDPDCYALKSVFWSQAGDYLYYADNVADLDGNRWDATLRIAFNHADVSLGSPELLLTAPGFDLGLQSLRPEGEDPANPGTTVADKYAAISYLDRSGSLTVSRLAVIDLECSASIPTMWQNCVSGSFQQFSGIRSSTWDSPETLLGSTMGKRHYEVHRLHTTGDSAGTDETVIANGRGADTGI